MVDQVSLLIQSIFKRGSKTYYYNSLFFPAQVKNDVYILYGFVRTADDYVDKIPQDESGFKKFKDEFIYCWKNGSSTIDVIEQFTKLAKRKKIKLAWIMSFLNTMESDLKKQDYKTLLDAKKYMYGSAEVIGLMMATILKLPTESYLGAQLLGRSMQYINFIRDLSEDFYLGRSYLPSEINLKYGIRHLTPEVAKSHPEASSKAIQHHISIYRDWLSQAKPYFTYIPKRSRIAIKTASDMYEYTADVIDKNPLIVFSKKVKPTKSRILLTGIINSFK